MTCLNYRVAEILSAQMAEHASCVPSMKPVPFPRDNRVNGMLWPTCVNVQRCGGCCGSDILSCVPTSVGMVTFYVSEHAHFVVACACWSGGGHVCEGHISRRLFCHDRCQSRREDEGGK